MGCEGWSVLGWDVRGGVCWCLCVTLLRASVARLGLLSSERVECCGSPVDTLAHHLDQLLSYSQ